MLGAGRCRAMSTARYFVTEQEEAAKNWQMIQQGKRLKATVARLENELLLFSVSWSKLGSVARTIEDIDYNAFHADSDNIKVSRPQSHDGGKILVIATLPAAHF